MKPLISHPNPAQPGMFRPRLRDIINPNRPLVKLAGAVDWLVFEKNLNPFFTGTGRRARPVRLMVGLRYLKCAFNHSDESVLAVWVENPYWQHFCGSVFFEQTPPVDSSSMTHWRAYPKKAGVGCIAKGKTHKRHEFGCKAGFVSSAKSNWILGAQAYHGNPYDGHTLKGALEQSARLTGVAARLTGVASRRAVCDLGYRGHDYAGECDIQIVQRRRKGISKSLSTLLKE